MCCDTACRVIAYGAASSVTVASPWLSRATMSRRVRSASAANMASSRSSSMVMLTPVIQADALSSVYWRRWVLLPAELTTSVDIDASPERVWQVLTDLPAYAEWNPFITEADGAVVVGERLTVRVPPVNAFVPATLRPAVLEVAPPGGWGCGAGSTGSATPGNPASAPRTATGSRPSTR
jgi:hypothetical protein